MFTSLFAIGDNSVALRPSRPLIVFIGDSLFNIPASPDNIPGVIAANLPGYDVVNLAVNGQKSSETLAGFSTAGGAADYYSSSRSKNVLVINTGANDVTSVGTGSTFDNIDAIKTAAESQGWFVIVTCSPSIGDAYFSGPNDTELANVGTEIRTAYPAANVADLRSNAHFLNQAAVNAGVGTYYNADEVHLAGTGVTLAVSIYQPLIVAAPESIVYLGSMAGQNSDNVFFTGGSGTLDDLTVTTLTATTLTATTATVNGVLSVKANPFGVGAGAFDEGVFWRDPVTNAILAGFFLSTNGSFPWFFFRTDSDVVIQNSGNTVMHRLDAGGGLTSVGTFESTTVGAGFVLKSPNGTRFRIAVSNAGALSAAAA